MTQYLWDTSHYDGVLTKAIMVRARAEGIVALTHKIGEGTGGDDPLDSTVLAAARDAGIPLLGGYHVVRSGSVGPQVEECIALADRDEPWWRDHPGWFWQVDLERWPYDQVPASNGISFARLVKAATGRVAALYASHGQYGNQLTQFTAADGPLWNAHYVSGSGGFKQLYPGDHWYPTSGAFVGGWGAYSGREPDFLQYTSSAVIAGTTTSDASAFRGTPEQLMLLLAPHSHPAPTPPNVQNGDMMVMRFSFDPDVPGRPVEVNDRIHLSDGVRYRILPDNITWPNALLTSAGAGPIVVVRGADVGGTDYATAVAVLCGTLDPGEESGTAGGLVAHTHPGGQTGPAVATLPLGPAAATP